MTSVDRKIPIIERKRTLDERDATIDHKKLAGGDRKLTLVNGFDIDERKQVRPVRVETHSGA